MNSVNTIVLVALVQTAAAAPASKPTRECMPSGGVMFEVAQRVERKAKLPTATTKLYENGAWTTKVIDVDGKIARTRAGCLEPSEVDSIRESLRAANWKATRSKATCRADQPRSTAYTWKGRLLYTERTCNIDVLDGASQHALDLIEIQLRIPLGLDGGDAAPDCMSSPLTRGCF